MTKEMVGAVALMLVAPPAWGEDVDLVGKFPAGSRSVAMLDSLAVERFAGRDGAQMSIALERALLRAEDDGQPHFRIRPEPQDADGVVSGAVSTGVREEGYKKTDERCAEKANGKCVRKEKVEIACRRRIVELTANVRVADRREGKIAWSGDPRRRKEISWCDGARPSETAEATVQGMITDVSGELRAMFAPAVRRYSVRFRESTKGLPKDMAAQFKGLVRQSQRDLPGACAGWDAIDRAAPDHVSTVFDIGVCAEAQGSLRDALTRYERASALLGRGNEAEADADRVRRLLAAKEVDAARGRR